MFHFPQKSAFASPLWRHREPYLRSPGPWLNITQLMSVYHRVLYTTTEALSWQRRAPAFPAALAPHLDNRFLDASDYSASVVKLQTVLSSAIYWHYTKRPVKKRSSLYLTLTPDNLNRFFWPHRVVKRGICYENVCPSVYHTCESRLNGSSCQNRVPFAL